MSLYVKALMLDDPETARKLTLPLACKMIQKIVGELGPQVGERDIVLYMMVLFKLVCDTHNEISCLYIKIIMCK